MMEKKSFIFKEADGLQLTVDAYIPEKPNGAAVLYYHGGAAIVGGREDTMGLELYLERGYTYLSPDYRLAPEVKLEALVEDTQDAYAWLLSHGKALLGIQTDRIAIAGCSFGGYLALLLGTRLHPKPSCVISLSGYGDLMGRMYALPDPFYQETAPVHTDMYIESQYAAAPLLAPDHKDRSAIYTHARQQGRWNQVVAGLDPASDFMKLLTYCPVRMMTCDMPPTFIIHGRADTDVSYDQAAQTAAALQSMGVEHRFISLDCGHGVYGDGADEAMRGSADFLDRHTSIT